MQRNVNNLVGYTISAKDGDMGKVSEFYFDDSTWMIRYLVVETGSWLFDRKVLIPHASLGITDWDAKIFHVNLTMDQIRNSPNIDTEKTVSRQHEIELFTHYTMPYYWGDIGYDGPVGSMPLMPVFNPTASVDAIDHSVMKSGDPHLRSTYRVTGYHIQANDGEIGHVADFIVSDENWKISFLIIDTHNWLPGRKVLIAPRWIKRIEWDESMVYVNLSREFIKNSPEFDPSQPISKEYENELFAHYGAHANKH